MEFDGVWVMMNGISGKMGIDVAAACLRKGFRIAPYAMSGKGSGDVSVSDLAVRTLFGVFWNRCQIILLSVREAGRLGRCGAKPGCMANEMSTCVDRNDDPLPDREKSDRSCSCEPILEWWA